MGLTWSKNPKGGKKSVLEIGIGGGEYSRTARLGGSVSKSELDGVNLLLLLVAPN